MSSKTLKGDKEIDKALNSILYQYVMWRDYYYSDFKDGVMTSREWIEVRDNIQKEARDQIKRLLKEQTNVKN